MIDCPRSLRYEVVATVGDCPQFSSNTVIKDSGFNCNGAPAVSFANPSAAAGPTANNGVATTAMRSDASPAVQKGTNSQFGLVHGDGTTISCAATPGICIALINGIFQTPTRAGDVVYWNGTSWVTLAGNNSGTNALTENSSGVPSWASVSGVTLTAGTGISFTSGSTCTTNCTVTNTGVVTVKKQVFASSGTYTPSTGMLFAQIECVGGGGGGGGANGASGVGTGAGGGGSGGYSKVIASAATIGASQTVTIGAAGSAGSAGNDAGGAGGATSVGSICAANGGSGGAGNSSSGAAVATGGAGGTAGTGDLTAAGAPGGPGSGTPSTNPVNSGFGGNSFFGGGAIGNNAGGSACVAGAAAGNYGSGGSGAVCNNTATATAGGAGSNGVVYVPEYNSQ